MSIRLTPPPERDFPAGRLQQRKEQLVSELYGASAAPSPALPAASPCARRRLRRRRHPRRGRLRRLRAHPARNTGGDDRLLRDRLARREHGRPPRRYEARPRQPAPRPMPRRSRAPGSPPPSPPACFQAVRWASSPLTPPGTPARASGFPRRRELEQVELLGRRARPPAPARAASSGAGSARRGAPAGARSRPRAPSASPACRAPRPGGRADRAGRSRPPIVVSCSWPCTRVIPSGRPERSFVAKLPSVATTVGSISSIWRKRCALARLDLVRLRVAVARRPALEDVRDVDVARASCRCRASSFSSSFPAWPTNGTPCLSSWKPGASPTNIRSACGLPAPNTTCVRPCASRQRVQPATASCVAPGARRRCSHRNGAHGARRLYDGTADGDDPSRARRRAAPRPRSRRPAALPSTARPTGESGETPPTLVISTVIRSPSSRSSSTRRADGDDAARRGRLLVDHRRVLQPVTQDS